MEPNPTTYSFADVAAALAYTLAQISGCLASRSFDTRGRVSPNEQSPVAGATAYSAQRGWRFLAFRHPEVSIRYHTATTIGAAGEDQDEGQCDAGSYGAAAATISPAEGVPARSQHVGQRAGKQSSLSTRSQICLSFPSSMYIVSFRLTLLSLSSLSLSLSCVLALSLSLCIRIAAAFGERRQLRALVKHFTIALAFSFWQHVIWFEFIAF